MIWMIVDHGVGQGTGYSRRVLFELEILAKHFGHVYLVYPADVFLPVEIKRISVPLPFEVGKPMMVQGRAVNKFLNFLAKQIGLPKLVYGQNLNASYAAYRFARENAVPLIFDYHGVVPYELRYVTGGVIGYVKSLVANYAEAKLLSDASYVVTVSEQFARYLHRKCPSIHPRTVVLPMLPSEVFFSRTKQPVDLGQLGISADDLVFCYLGQSQPWQMPEETVSLYAKIEKKLRNTYFLVLTKDVSTFQSYAYHAGIKRYKIITVPHEEVPYYLQVCDYGFVLRNPDIINQVASPTKVLEYLACGVIPIMTEHVGDFPVLLTLEELAKVIPFARLNDDRIVDSLELSKPSQTVRDRALAFVASFSQRYVTNYVKVLESIL